MSYRYNLIDNNFLPRLRELKNNSSPPHDSGILGGGLAYSISHGEEEITIEVDVPGVKNDDLEIDIGSGDVIINAIRYCANGKKVNYYQHINFWSEKALSNKALAVLNDGVLTIKIPEQSRVKLKPT